MVQIIQRPPSKLDSFMQSLNTGLAGANQGIQSIKGALNQRKERNRLSDLLGEDISDIRNPDFQRQILGSHLSRQEQADKMRGESEAEKSNYEKIKKAFGEEFAEVWLASPTGARTALETAAIQQGLRKLPVGGIFGDEGEEQSAKSTSKPNKPFMLPSGEEFQFPELPQQIHRTPAEQVKYHDSLRKENSPIFKETVNKSRGLKDTGQHLDILEDLNEKIPEGASRLLIDKEGNIRPSALRFKAVSKEVERFSKTVNDFLTSAKDIFGSRVTNYDIAQFKMRLPNLLNSKEGRSEIIQQMKILNKIELNYRNALKEVYRRYGTQNISPEQAEEIAEMMTMDEEESLRAQIEKIGMQDFSEAERPSLEEIFG